MFKKLFDDKNKVAQIKLRETDVVLRLMFEIAISDGNLDASELQIIKDRANKIASEDEKASKIIKKIIDETKDAVSFYPSVEEINKTHSHEEKKELLEILWNLVRADSIIDPYEENLYFKIAELIKIKRVTANQIKQENS
jgi:uncharacterized tellurite resistance protein B-like protein